MVAYTPPAIAGYNTNPPTDDGSQTVGNTISWNGNNGTAGVKQKLVDPVKLYADAINTAVATALAAITLYDTAQIAMLRSLNFLINGGMQVGQRAAPSLSTSYQYGKVDRWAGSATGGAVGAGTLTQSTGSAASSTGQALHFSGITLTGAGKLAARYRMEAKDAVRLKNKTVIFAANAWHDIGSSKNATITFNKPTVADDFTVVSNIAASGNLAVADQTSTAIAYSSPLGDCTNGLEIIVELTTGAITTKNFHGAEAGLYLGAAAPATFSFEPFQQVLAQCERYYEKTFPYGTAPAQNATTAGCATGLYTGAAVIVWTYKARKRAAPTVTLFDPTAASATLTNITAVASGLAGAAQAYSNDGQVTIRQTGGGGSLGDIFGVHLTADAEL